jgi:hypothetical protein
VLGGNGKINSIFMIIIIINLTVIVFYYILLLMNKQQLPRVNTMAKKQEDKTTKSIQFDTEYNANVIEPFLKKEGMSFSFMARRVIIKHIEEKTKNNEK